MEQRRRNSSGAEGDAGGVLWSQPAEPRCCEDRVAVGPGLSPYRYGPSGGSNRSQGRNVRWPFMN